jgi:phosphoribosylamine-glycine ligase
VAVSDPEEARAVAEEIGYPVVVKARAGAGGRGIRVVEEPGALSEAFRAAADAFDEKVTQIRQRQDAKVRAIGQMQEAERQTFFAAALPVIEEVVRGRGAVAVLDSRAIFVAADAIDITDDLVAQIDAALGAGTEAPLSGEPAEMPQPDGEGGGRN